MLLTVFDVDNLKIEIDQNGDMPNSVRKVLNNTSLTGIHNTIGNILTTEDKYVKNLCFYVKSPKGYPLGLILFSYIIF